MTTDEAAPRRFWVAPEGSTCVHQDCSCPCHKWLGREVLHALDAELTYLTPRERQIFDQLLDELGDWVSKKVICDRMFAFHSWSEIRNLTVTLSRMRAKLAEHQAPWQIDSLAGSLSNHGSLRLRMVTTLDQSADVA